MRRATARAALGTTLVALATFGTPSANATVPPPRLTQYGHTVWRTQDGAMLGANVATQTTDGYVWIATETGLLRFDGTRFVPIGVLANGSLANDKILSLWPARDGALWVGGIGFAERVKNGVTTRYATVGRVGSFAEDDHGTVWFSQTRVNGNGGPVCSVTGSTLRCFGKPDLPLVNAGTVRWTAADGLSITNATTICRWSVGSPAHCDRNDALVPFENLVGIATTLRTRDGTLWVGIDQTGPGFGLTQFDGTRWTSFTAPGFDASTIAADSLLEDRQGTLWVGTLDRGVFHIANGRVDHFGSAEGLSSDAVSGGMFEDREGIIWVSTAAGLDAFRRLPISVLSTREGLPADAVSAVLPMRDGTVWISSQSLTALRDDRPVAVPAGIPFTGANPTSLLEDHAGRIWTGLNNRLFVFDQGRSTAIRTSGGDDAVGVVTSIVEDAAHDVWFLTAGNRRALYRVRDGIAERPAALSAIDARGPLAAGRDGSVWIAGRNGTLTSFMDDAVTTYPAAPGPIVHLMVDPDGTALAATGSGLLLQSGGSRRFLDVEHGLPCRAIEALIRDALGDLWMLAGCGLIHISNSELLRWRAAPDTIVVARLFDATDGVRLGKASFSPAAGLAPDGRVWFATDSAVQVVDPALVDRPAAPPVRIEELVADRTTIATNRPVRLLPRTRDIEIHYTALSFKAPQKLRFQYRLEGRDDAWRDAGTLRQAFYTDLPPGAYRFRVKASGGDGAWSEDAAVAFTIPPAWYQTRWFIGLCALAIGASLYGFYRIKMRQVAATVRDRLAVKNAERERIARDLHDTLLQSTQALILRFQQAAQRIPHDEPARHLMERALARADETLVESRDRVRELRSDGHATVDIAAALQRTVEALHDANGGAPIVGTVGAPRPLVSMVADEVLLIAREALVNAMNHARARRIGAEIAFEPAQLTITIDDDGIGIPDAVLRAGRDGHWGLLGMRERAARIGARLDVHRAGDHGTVVKLAVPANIAYAGFHEDTARRRSWWRILGRADPD